jgi:hypothetical protein
VLRSGQIVAPSRAPRERAVALINRAAITYLLERNFCFGDDGFFCMSDEPFGKFD